MRRSHPLRSLNELGDLSGMGMLWGRRRKGAFVYYGWRAGDAGRLLRVRSTMGDLFWSVDVAGLDASFVKDTRTCKGPPYKSPPGLFWYISSGEGPIAPPSPYDLPASWSMPSHHCHPDAFHATGCDREAIIPILTTTHLHTPCPMPLA